MEGKIRMITKVRFLIFLLILILLASCDAGFDTPIETQMEIDISHTLEGKVDFDALLTNAQTIIKEKLPYAEYAGTFYKQSCLDQKQKNGRMTIIFIDNHPVLLSFQQQILFARLVINLEDGKSDLVITDESENAPSVSKYKKITNDNFQKMLTAVDNHYSKNKIDDCLFEITQMKDYWHVLVWSPSSSKYLAEFGIDWQSNVIKVANPITK